MADIANGSPAMTDFTPPNPLGPKPRLEYHPPTALARLWAASLKETAS